MEGRIDEDRAAAEPERIILTAKIGKWVSILGFHGDETTTPFHNSGSNKINEK